MDPDPYPSYFLLTIFNTFDSSALLGLVVMAFLLICSAFISGAEVAFFALSPSDKKELETNKSKSGDLILELLQRPKRLLATILIANNFVNIGIVVLSTFIADAIFNFHDTSVFGIPFSATTQEFLILVVLLTFLILFFGEVTPKVYANKNPLQLSGLMAIPISIMLRFFWFVGLSKFLIFSTSVIDKKIKKKPDGISVEDLSTALELTNDEEVTEDEQRILEGIVKFGNTDVKQIMKSRMDVVAFDVETPYGELINKVVESGYSRIPIFKDTFDKIEGILYIKDLLPHLGKDEHFKWQPIIREPYYVPETKKIDDLLKDFQSRKIHLAVVVDEYGGSSGIITLEDIIEEIVGDITDEFDEEEIQFSQLDESNYVFEGKTHLTDMYKVLNIDGELFENSKGDSDTLAGFLLELSGKLLNKNEKVNFEGYTFTIEAADKKRIKQVKITIPDAVDDLNESEND